MPEGSSLARHFGRGNHQAEEACADCLTHGPEEGPVLSLGRDRGVLKKILIVDEDESLQMLYSDLAVRSGIENPLRLFNLER